MSINQINFKIMITYNNHNNHQQHVIKWWIKYHNSLTWKVQLYWGCFPINHDYSKLFQWDRWQFGDHPNHPIDSTDEVIFSNSSRSVQVKQRQKQIRNEVNESYPNIQDHLRSSKISSISSFLPVFLGVTGHRRNTLDGISSPSAGIFISTALESFGIPTGPWIILDHLGSWLGSFFYGPWGSNLWFTG